LWFTLILVVILVSSGILTRTVLERYLRQNVDDHLKVHSAEVHGTLSSGTVPDPLDYEVVHSSLPRVEEIDFPVTYVQIRDGDGIVVVKSDNLFDQQLPLSPLLVANALEGQATTKTVSTEDDGRMRIMASPLYLGNETLVLEVGQSLAEVDATMDRVTWALLAGIVSALALAVMSGAFIVRRALSPVERITNTARTIEASSDLGQRVGHTGPMDEIGKLAATFDHMIEHLDRAFKSQRQFVADASHDLRSPLTVLLGNLDLLKLNLGEEDRKESLRAMEAEIERMSKTVDDLLFLAEVESGQTEEEKGDVSLRDILLDARVRAAKLAGDRTVTLGRVEDLHVQGARHRLERMVGNLVDNALKYTPEGGIITLSLFRDEDWAQVDVSDTGIGIAAEHVPHIFDRLYRVDRSRSRLSGGSGLGLAIVKGIVEQHGGEVSVESEPGRGTTFTVRLRL
jgi:heavy metal sensor kinase